MSTPLLTVIVPAYNSEDYLDPVVNHARRIR